MKQLPQDFRTQASGDYNKPLEIVDIYLDNNSYYFVSNNTENINFYNAISGDSVTYYAAPVSRESASSSAGLDIDNVRIGLANVDKTLVGYLQAEEFRSRRIVIRQIFSDLLTSSGDAVVIFDGLMDSPAVDQNWLSITAKPRISTLKKKAPGRWYQLPCNWKFGDQYCTIDVSDPLYTKSKVAGAGCSTTRISGDDLSEGSGYWRRGYVRFTSGNNLYQRTTIRSSGAGYIELDGFLPYTPSSGDTYTVVAGCDKTLFMCSGDYANEANFGGFHTIPENMIIKG